MVSVSASAVNLSLHHKVQKFSSGTVSPGRSRKKDRKTVVVVVVWGPDKAVCLCVCVRMIAFAQNGLWRDIMQGGSSWPYYIVQVSRYSHRSKLKSPEQNVSFGVKAILVNFMSECLAPNLHYEYVSTWHVWTLEFIFLLGFLKKCWTNFYEILERSCRLLFSLY